MFSEGASRKFLKKANFGKTVDIGGVSIGIIFLPTFQVHNDDKQKLAKTHGLLTVIIARNERFAKRLSDAAPDALEDMHNDDSLKEKVPPPSQSLRHSPTSIGSLPRCAARPPRWERRSRHREDCRARQCRDVHP